MIAVIQAGGKGTRITSITEDKIPKPMLKIADRPILYHQIMNLKKYGIREVIIIVSHLGNVIKDYFKDGEDLGVKISYVLESPDVPLGTAGALFYLKNTIKDDFIFLLGDIFIDIDFKRFIFYHKSHKGDVTLLTHPNNHPFDSDLILTNNNLVIGIDYKDNVRTNYHNLVNAGVMIFSSHCLEFIKECKKYNYEKDIIFPLIKKHMVYSYKTSEYVKDIGTPERYNQVVHDYYNNIPSIKNLSNLQKCIFLDCDVIFNKNFVTNLDNFQLSTDFIKGIKRINESGYLCIIITNQNGITLEYLNEIYKKLETLLGENNAYIDDIFCFSHYSNMKNDSKIIKLKSNDENYESKMTLIENATFKYHIDITKSYIIVNNSESDYAKKNGLKSVSLIDCDKHNNLYEVINNIIDISN